MRKVRRPVKRKDLQQQTLQKVLLLLLLVLLLLLSNLTVRNLQYLLKKLIQVK